MTSPAPTSPIPVPVLKPTKWPWDLPAHRVVQDSVDRRANKVNRVQRDQKALGVRQALQDLRVPQDPRDRAVCPFKECRGCRARKERKETPASPGHRVSQEAWAHQDVMVHQAKGDFLERMVPPALQDPQGQLAFLEHLESLGSRAARDRKAPWGHLASLEQREREANEATCNLRPW